MEPTFEEKLLKGLHFLTLNWNRPTLPFWGGFRQFNHFYGNNPQKGMAQIMTLLIRWAGQVGGKTVPLNNNNTTFFSIDFGIYKTKLMQKAGGNISSVLNYIVYILQSQWPVPGCMCLYKISIRSLALFLSGSSFETPSQQQRRKLPAFDAG